MKATTVLASLALLFSFTSAAEPVNVNSASADEIASSLSGIGATKAAAIVAHRAENGPFTRIQDLLAVSGIGERLIDKIKADLRLEETSN